MFVTARNNQFSFNFPKTFIPKEIADKYRPYITRIPGGMIKEPIDLFNYAIQSINLPGPSYEPIQQNSFPGNTRSYRTSVPTPELYDKNLTVTVNAFDGYVNYWMAVDLLSYYYSLSGKEPFLPENPGIQMLDAEGNNYITIKMKQMILKSVSSLDLNFSSNTIEFQTFDMEFSYNHIDIKTDLI